MEPFRNERYQHVRSMRLSLHSGHDCGFSGGYAVVDVDDVSSVVRWSQSYLEEAIIVMTIDHRFVPLR